MDIRHLTTFQTIARLASFTKASEELSYSQSTLTIHVQAIEKELNGKVFERIGKNIIITDLGKELLSIADVILTAHKKIEMLKRRKFFNESTIKIGAQESVAVYRLQSIINRFQHDYPKVKIIQVFGKKDELTSKLLSSEIDLMCVMQRHQENDKLIAIELVKENMGIVGTYSQLQTLDDLENQSTVFIYPKSDCSYRKAFDNYLGKYLGNRRNIIEALSIEAIKQSIVINSGISVLPYSTVEIEVVSGEMSFFKLDLSSADEISTQLIYHKNKWISPLLRKFTDFLMDEMSMS